MRLPDGAELAEIHQAALRAAGEAAATIVQRRLALRAALSGRPGSPLPRPAVLRQTNDSVVLGWTGRDGAIAESMSRKESVAALEGTERQEVADAFAREQQRLLRERMA